MTVAMMLSRGYAIAGVGIWLTILGWIIWSYASIATEPPVWDALTYSAKAKAFWQAAGSGDWISPFALEPTVRPPATVLVSYPFGFSEDFAGFYFRTNFVPACLLALAILLVGWATRSIATIPWGVAAIAICFAGVPPTFQFQLVYEELPSAGSWGLVDNFLAGVAALSAATLIAASARGSHVWTVLSALLAGLCLWIKPAGLLVMFSVFFAWVCIEWREIKEVRGLSSSTVKGLISFLTAYALAGGIAYFSPYFSSANIDFGSRAMEVARTESSGSLSYLLLVRSLHVGTGWALAAILMAGLFVAVKRRDQRWAVPASLAALAAGVWFWLVAIGDATQVRYFLPFAVVAAVFLLPGILEASTRLSQSARAVLLGVVALPAIASTAVASAFPPSKSVQRILGINLSANGFANEGRLAAEVLIDASSRGLHKPKIFVCSLSSALASFTAVVEYDREILRSATGGSVVYPVDWTRGFAFRLDEMLGADYILCERPEHGEAAADECDARSSPAEGKRCAKDRNQVGEMITESRDLPTFEAESDAIRNWLSMLGDADGLTALPAGGLTLLRVVDRGKFEQALSAFASAYRWRAIAADGYTARWWSEEELTRESTSHWVASVNVPFLNEHGSLLQTMKGLRIEFSGKDAIIDVWLEPGPGTPFAIGEDWRLFAHLEDQSGTVVSHTESRVSRLGEYGRLRQYRLTFYGKGGSASGKIGFGIYKVEGGGSKDIVFLRSKHAGMDWDGRRYAIPFGVYPTRGELFGQSAAQAVAARRWTEADLARETARLPLTAMKVGFHEDGGQLVWVARGARALIDGPDLLFDVWVQAGPYSASSSEADWRLFCHIEDAVGRFIAHQEFSVSSNEADDRIRQYRFEFPGAAKLNAKNLAFGFWNPGDVGRDGARFLRSSEKDGNWGGRRVVIPFGPYPNSRAAHRSGRESARMSAYIQSANALAEAWNYGMRRSDPS